MAGSGRLTKQLRIALRAWVADVRGQRARAERHWRRLVWRALEGRADELTFVRDGVRWTVPVGPFSVAANCFVEGDHQGREIRAVLGWLGRADRLRTGAALIDVGANLGTPAIPIARASALRVVAVEPVPWTFGFLRRNVEQNGLSQRVAAVNAAIARERGALDMAVHPDGSRAEVDTGGAQGFGGGANARRVRVPALGLDDLCADHALAPADVALVWSDTQGYERAVIESGKSLWAAGVPLFVELWPTGLAAHGGVGAFADSARSHFARFVLREDLVSRAEAATAHPIDALPKALADLGDGHSDALLLP